VDRWQRDDRVVEEDGATITGWRQNGTVSARAAARRSTCTRSGRAGEAYGQALSGAWGTPSVDDAVTVHLGFDFIASSRLEASGGRDPGDAR